MADVEYEVTYSLRRRLPGEDDYTEIGFGVSGEWSNPAMAGHMVLSALQNYEWETEKSHPDPDEIRDAVESGERDG